MSKQLVKSADLEYYSFDPILSYNATYNFVVGARGLGKTYGAKKLVIKSAIKSHIASGGKETRQFIYLRRYKPELKAASSLFADIFHEFPEWEFRYEGDEFQMSKAGWVAKDKKDKRPWTTIGYAMALSTNQHQKSRAFPLVTWILYDEFIIEKGAVRYLSNEAKAFNDLYLTVDRWKDKTRVLFLANSLSIANPFFMEYDILPEDGKSEELIIKGDGFLLAHFPDSAQFAAGVAKTKFGRFISGTSYENYAVNNTFADNHNGMIASKPPEALYQMTLDSVKGTVSVWADWGSMNFYVQEKRPKQERIWVTEASRMKEGRYLTERSDKRLQRYRAAFNQGRVFFDSTRTRNAFIEIFRR